MRLLLDEMYSERVAQLLVECGHDAVHVRALGLGGAADSDVLARATREHRALVTENAADFLPLLDVRQSAGEAMTPVLVASTRGRGVGGALHARLAAGIHQWTTTHRDPYEHAHWLP